MILCSSTYHKAEVVYSGCQQMNEGDVQWCVASKVAASIWHHNTCMETFACHHCNLHLPFIYINTDKIIQLHAMLVFTRN